MARAMPGLLDLDGGREALRLCNSFNRLPTLINIAGRMEWWGWLRLLGEEWSVCDNIGKNADRLLDETPFADLAERPQGRELLMDADEQAALAALPDEVTVFRGCYASNKWGLSWSLDRDLAAKFPTLNRYTQDGQAFLVKARVRKADIIALKLDRGEAEIIALRPKHISTSKLR